MDKIVWFKNQAVLSTVEKQNGIGFIQAVDMEDQTLKVYFPLVKEDRLYSAKTTVLQRYLLREGKTLSHQGVQELVNKANELGALVRSGMNIKM